MSNDVSPEHLIIRPPSEWRSLLIRVTRGCSWNRCRFCGIYPALGQPDFSARTIEEVKRDIDCFAQRLSGLRPETAFLGDADPLSVGVENAAAILRYVRKVFPRIARITAYARASTIRKLGSAGIKALAKAGLNRAHVGLESGDPQTLKFHFKGQTPRTVTDAGLLLKEAGIEVSVYVLLGLGGAARWKEHADETASVVNRVNPEFVRLRRLWLFRGGDGQTRRECPLWDEIRKGTFEPQTAEGTVLELRRLIEGLCGVGTEILCDHTNNYIQLTGTMPQDKERLLAEIDGFLALPKSQREDHYAMVGSRL